MRRELNHFQLRSWGWYSLILLDRGFHKAIEAIVAYQTPSPPTIWERLLNRLTGHKSNVAG